MAKYIPMTDPCMAYKPGSWVYPSYIHCNPMSSPRKNLSDIEAHDFSGGWYPIISGWVLLGKKSHRSKWMMTGGTPYVTWETPVFDFCCSSPVVF